MVAGAEFGISYQRLAYLSNVSRIQMIQNLGPSTIVWRKCDIRIWKILTGQAVLLELTLLASVTHKKNPYLVNVAFAVGRLFTKG
jgi:hypothetical protein